MKSLKFHFKTCPLLWGHCAGGGENTYGAVQGIAKCSWDETGTRMEPRNHRGSMPFFWCWMFYGGSAMGLYGAWISCWQFFVINYLGLSSMGISGSCMFMFLLVDLGFQKPPCLVECWIKCCYIMGNQGFFGTHHWFIGPAKGNPPV